MANPKLETLVKNFADAQEKERKAKAELEAGLESVPHGHVLTINNIPYQVTVMKGKKVCMPMLSKRAIAAINGEKVPELRPRKTKEDKAAQ